MFETLKRLFDEGKLSENGINNAVLKGWITEEQKLEIMSH
ncbi:MAG: XkdX family protein [Clostridia bacterium]|nr:XkdX family protein [Clostridia bacterium]